MRVPPLARPREPRPARRAAGPGSPTCQMQGPGALQVARAPGAVGRAPVQQQAVVRPTQQLVVPQRELVPGQELAAADGAAEALDVVHVVPGSHHQITAAESHLALGTLDAEQPAGGKGP